MVLGQPVVEKVFPLAHLKEVAKNLPDQKNGSLSQFMAKLITEMVKERSPQQVQDMFNQSGILLYDLGLSENEVDKILFIH